MGKTVLIFFVFAMSLISSQQSHAVVLYPMDDAPISAGAPSTNFNNYTVDLESELWTGLVDGSSTQTYLKFNLSGIGYIGEAMLYLYNGLDSGTRSSFDSANVDAYSVASSWKERSITWDTKPFVTTSDSSNALVGTAVGWYAWNITSLAQASGNGVLSLGLTSDGAGHVYYGREASSDYMPYISINGTVPEPATIISFSSFILVFLPGIRRKILG